MVLDGLQSSLCLGKWPRRICSFVRRMEVIVSSSSSSFPFVFSHDAVSFFYDQKPAASWPLSRGKSNPMTILFFFDLRPIRYGFYIPIYSWWNSTFFLSRRRCYCLFLEWVEPPQELRRSKNGRTFKWNFPPEKLERTQIKRKKEKNFIIFHFLRCIFASFQLSPLKIAFYDFPSSK